MIRAYYVRQRSWYGLPMYSRSIPAAGPTGTLGWLSKSLAEATIERDQMKTCSDFTVKERPCSFRALGLLLTGAQTGYAIAPLQQGTSYRSFHEGLYIIPD